MHTITFNDGTRTLTGFEVTWNTLPEAVSKLGGDLDDRYEDATFVEIGEFNGSFMEQDFDQERIYALSNGSILSCTELIERGFDWS